MKLVVDATAAQDLLDITQWIAKDNTQAALRVLTAILRTIDQLQYFPRLARVGRAAGTFERVVPGISFY
jgi:plasmid stabilization system protein ParE